MIPVLRCIRRPGFAPNGTTLVGNEAYWWWKQVFCSEHSKQFLGFDPNTFRPSVAKPWSTNESCAHTVWTGQDCSKIPSKSMVVAPNRHYTWRVRFCCTSNNSTKSADARWTNFFRQPGHKCVCHKLEKSVCNMLCDQVATSRNVR